MITKEEQIQRVKAKIKEIEGLREQPFMVETNMQELLTLIHELSNLTPNDAIIGSTSEKKHYQSAWHSLAHTKDKEGEALIYYDKEARKPRASRKALERYYQAFNDFIRHVRSDTIMIR